ncbi:hypothetical protein BDQ12DRAFT_728323 [Crucibulum laeve]|uniref:Uncharacterized protein n=1 Tax=Crucibulum laeve TaxID=68775 RepID=A0A5C3LJD8_9AGAR|nr:hypothetical protein BDQ12DRAFT_728323 [Crucibulum laeve]
MHSTCSQTSTTCNGLCKGSPPPSKGSQAPVSHKHAPSATDATTPPKKTKVLLNNEHIMEEMLEKGGGKGKKGKKDKKTENKGLKKITVSEATTTSPGVVNTPVHLTKSEKVLEDSGISVAPPR